MLPSKIEKNRTLVKYIYIYWLGTYQILNTVYKCFRNGRKENLQPNLINLFPFLGSPKIPLGVFLPH